MLLIHPELKPLTWDERIKRAEESGNFTYEDILLAADWNTCAVGEALNSAREPISHKWMFILRSNLSMPGIMFATAVGHNEVSLARKLFEEIKRVDVNKELKEWSQ